MLLSQLDPSFRQRMRLLYLAQRSQRRKCGQLPAAKVANDHLGLGDNGIHIIGPPLEHLLALFCVLGAVIDAGDAARFMAY